MARYLKKIGTDEVYIHTDLLMARGDMEEYIPPKPSLDLNRDAETTEKTIKRKVKSIRL